MTIYSVKEMFLSVQGEGAQSGRVCVFVRFAGCNLWNGLERDRENAICQFCDTDFVGTNGKGGGRFATPQALVRAARGFWPGGANPWVICTGGEPMLQLDAPLIAEFHQAGFKIAVETNGTLEVPASIDWICVSPKANANLRQTSGHELKLVYPQAQNRPEDFAGLDFNVFSLQPLDDEQAPAHRKAAFDYVTKHPQWRLSLQTHKWLGVR